MWSVHFTHHRADSKHQSIQCRDMDTLGVHERMPFVQLMRSQISVEQEHEVALSYQGRLAEPEYSQSGLFGHATSPVSENCLVKYDPAQTLYSTTSRGILNGGPNVLTPKNKTKQQYDYSSRKKKTSKFY